MPLLLGASRRHARERVWAMVALALGLAAFAGLIVSRLGGNASTSRESTNTRTEEPARRAEPSRREEPARPAAKEDPPGEVSDVPALLAADPESVAGRQIELTEVAIEKMISKRAFTVDDGLLVMLDDRIADQLAERKATLEPGIQLRIRGRLWPAPAPDVAQERYKGLSVAESAAMRAQRVYLHAEALSRPKK